MKADSVAGPRVVFDESELHIDFVLDDFTWGRVTFERFDAIRVCRGEYAPYGEPPDEDEYSWVSIIDDSPWLLERYRYEKRYYGDSYNFTGDADEMLHDFSHYVFHFHDEFVEVVCAGIRFRPIPKPVDSPDGSDFDVAQDPGEDRWALQAYQAHGIECCIRKSLRPHQEIVRDAQLASEPIVQVGFNENGRFRVHWSMELRGKSGPLQSHLRGYFGNLRKVIDGIGDVADILPVIDEWLLEISVRRKEMGLPKEERSN